MVRWNIFPMRSSISLATAAALEQHWSIAALPGSSSAARPGAHSVIFPSAIRVSPFCPASVARGRSLSKRIARVIRKLLSGSIIAALRAGTASADTLREALVSAYQANPTLTAQREALRATDATVAIARAAGRPQVSGTVGLNRNLTRSGVIVQTQGDAHNISVSGGVDVSYSLFNGGAVRNNVRAAQSRVDAGRATLRAVEGDVFTQAVSAYMDVIRDRAVVELNSNNVRVLTTNLEATRDRFQIGDLTSTDVAQSEARLQIGRSQLAQAQGQLTA